MHWHRCFTFSHLIVVKTYLKTSPYLIFTFSPRKHLFHAGAFEHVIFFPLSLWKQLVLMFIGGINATFFFVVWQVRCVATVRNLMVESSSWVSLSGICAGACEVLKGSCNEGTPRLEGRMGSLRVLQNMTYLPWFSIITKSPILVNNKMYSEKNSCKGHKKKHNTMLAFLSPCFIAQKEVESEATLNLSSNNE